MGTQFQINTINDMVIRVTENKREVGILKTQFQSKEALPVDVGNAGKYPQNTLNTNKKNIFLNRCSEKNLDLNGQSPLDKGTESKPDYNNNESTEVVQNFQDSVISTNTEIEGEISKRNIEPVLQQPTLELGDLESELDKKSNSKTSSKCKEIEHLTKRKSEEETYITCPTVKSFVNTVTRDVFSDSSDEESKQKHPNRRLQLERPEVDLPVKKPRSSRPNRADKEEHQSVKKVKSVVITAVNKHFRSDYKGKRPRGTTSLTRVVKLTKEEKSSAKNGQVASKKWENIDSSHLCERESEYINRQCDSDCKGKRPREMSLTRVVKLTKEENSSAKDGQVASKMWENIIDSPNMWEGETEYINEQFDDKTSDRSERGMNYNRMLNEFASQRRRENKEAKGEALYEERVKEMFKDSNPSYMLKEFYIPPALVELFYQKTVLGQAAVDSLREICKLKKWPEPTFACVSSEKGFLYSCALKKEIFIPTKTASNEDLAKELAALECLQWLGLEHRAYEVDSTFEDMDLS